MKIIFVNDIYINLDGNHSKNWLRDNVEPEDEVKTHWNNSYSLRVSELYETNNKTITEIYNEWPILKNSDGYKLVMILKKEFKMPLLSI